MTMIVNELVVQTNSKTIDPDGLFLSKIGVWKRTKRLSKQNLFRGF